MEWKIVLILFLLTAPLYAERCQDSIECREILTECMEYSEKCYKQLDKCNKALEKKEKANLIKPFAWGWLGGMGFIVLLILL